MRVLVCGGRDFDDRDLVHQVLDVLQPKAVIAGGAEGADTFATQWARAMMLEAPIYYADWENFGKAAGPIRNLKMLVEGKPDLVIAFPGGKGTRDLVKRAIKRGVPVVAVVPPAYWGLDELDEKQEQLALPGGEDEP